jgi:hypothetical protein
MKKATVGMVITAWASIMMAEDIVRFIGSDGSGENGAVTLAENWEGGTIPSGAQTGLITAPVKKVWVGGPLTAFSMRQTGGCIKAPTGMELRGGPAGSGVGTVYIIDDPDTNYTSYVNLETAKDKAIVFWSMSGEKCELSLLSGHIEAGMLKLNASDKGIINVRNGIFHVGKMAEGKGTINMLAAGTGAVTVDVLGCTLGQLKLNFETGNKGSFTISQKEGGASADGIWQQLIGNRQLSIDGKVVKDPRMFEITTYGTSATIKLATTVILG